MVHRDLRSCECFEDAVNKVSKRAGAPPPMQVQWYKVNNSTRTKNLDARKADFFIDAPG